MQGGLAAVMQNIDQGLSSLCDDRVELSSDAVRMLYSRQDRQKFYLGVTHQDGLWLNDRTGGRAAWLRVIVMAAQTISMTQALQRSCGSVTEACQERGIRSVGVGDGMELITRGSSIWRTYCLLEFPPNLALLPNWSDCNTC
jgi:hypothetical protein